MTFHPTLRTGSWKLFSSISSNLIMKQFTVTIQCWYLTWCKKFPEFPSNASNVRRWTEMSLKSQMLACSSDFKSISDWNKNIIHFLTATKCHIDHQRVDLFRSINSDPMLWQFVPLWQLEAFHSVICHTKGDSLPRKKAFFKHLSKKLTTIYFSSKKQSWLKIYFYIFGILAINF